MAFAKENNIIISEEWRVFGYNSPMVPDAQNYFEVQVIISKEKPTNTVESSSDENVTAPITCILNWTTPNSIPP